MVGFSLSDLEELLKGRVTILPLYWYDHGRLALRTCPFSGPWDSEQVGFIHCPYDRLLEETELSAEEFFVTNGRTHSVAEELLNQRGGRVRRAFAGRGF